MMLDTLLSVIIPVYNTEPYLEQCLDSVINQTYKNMEIICINDGSTDNSLKILEKYRLKDSRVKVISQEYKGVAETRNAGLREAKGKYIGFVDSDDYIEPTMYEKLITPMLKDPSIDFSAVGTFIEYEDGSHPPKKQTLPLSGKNRSFIHFKAAYGYLWNKVYKNSIIQDRNIDFPVGLYFEDYSFSNAYAINSKYAYYVDGSLYHYRKRKNSICGSANQAKYMHRKIDKIKACLYFYDYLKKFCNSKKYKKYVCLRINKYINLILKDTNSTQDETWKVKWELAKEIFEICKRNDFTFDEKLSFWISLVKNLFEKKS